MAQPVSTMMLKYTYLKPRQKFGKQCIFETMSPLGVENIWPNPEDAANYIQYKQCDRQMQLSTQFATHDAQTETILSKDTGMLHVEGGWPKEINPSDGEATHRFIRRVEKDPSYATSMGNLMPLMEYHVCQNNAVNIHQNFFDDMIPTHLVKQYDIRIWNSYEDPQKFVRPIRSLSWSPDGSNRLAAAYSFTEFEDYSADVNLCSYVWDIGNAIKPMIELESSSAMLSLQFNPRDISMLISGHMSGQVCCWDIRIGGKPMHTSDIYYSHGCPATKCLWTSSKANTEFFSSSSGGTVMWWDIRFMNTPISVMVMDVDNPRRGNRFKAVGITALNYEHTMSNKFLVGLVNGLVFNINRKNVSPDDQFTMKFECYTGAVHALDRNPFVPKNFLSIGDWSAKIWSEDTREGFLLNTREQKVSLTGGCWSRSRGSIFFTTNKHGLLEAYDVLTGMQNPLASIHVCSDSLTAISSNDEGELIAVGSSKGSIYVLECLEGLTSFTREDKACLLSHMEGCSRFERVLDNRLREIRLYRSTIDEEPTEPVGKPKAKIKAKEEPKAKKKAEDTKKKPKEDKKLKRVRSKRKESALVDIDLIEAQKRYFEIVEAETEKMVDIDPEDKAAVQSLLEMRVVMKSEDPSEEEVEDDLPKVRSQKSIRMRKMSRRSRKPSLAVAESDLLIEPIMADDKAGHRGKGARRHSILKTCPLEVCKPEICCKDVMDKRKRRGLKKKISMEDLIPPKMLTPFVVQSKSYQTLADFTDQFEKPTREMRRQILKQRLLPPNILKRELAQAKSAVRRWQEEILAGKLSFRAVKRTISLKALMSSASAVVPDPSEMMEKMADQPASRAHSVATTFATHRGTGKRRRTKLTLEDESELIEQEKQRQWQELKMKVKEFEKKRDSRTYPRISAARRISKSEDTP